MLGKNWVSLLGKVKFLIQKRARFFVILNFVVVTPIENETKKYYFAERANHCYGVELIFFFLNKN